MPPFQDNGDIIMGDMGLLSPTTDRQGASIFRDSGSDVFTLSHRDAASLDAEGMYEMDDVDDLSTAKNAFLLALQDEPLLPWEHNEFQAKQDGLMIDLVMGIVVTQDGSETDAYRRIGLARWIDAELLLKSKPRTVKLL